MCILSIDYLKVTKILTNESKGITRYIQQEAQRYHKKIPTRGGNPKFKGNNLKS